MSSEDEGSAENHEGATSADDDELEESRRARAAELRREIEALQHPPPDDRELRASPEDEEVPAEPEPEGTPRKPFGGESLREFVQRRMREIRRSGTDA